MTFEQLVDTVASAVERVGVHVDSRLVERGDVFVAVPGTVHDGHSFLDRAVAGGAAYVVCQADHPAYRSDSAQVVSVPDSAEAAAILAQAARGYPARKMTSLAVTGTNGKTTVAFLTRCCLESAGRRCGLIGTILYDVCSGQSIEASLTTPDSTLIASLCEQMADNGATHMVTEASSHALSQNRLAGIDFAAAAFTNLSGDHLDYHGTPQEYLQAKARLFERLGEGATAVLNKQSAEAHMIAERIAAPVVWYAVDEEADVAAKVQSMEAGGTRFMLEARGEQCAVRLPLVGAYNVSNALAAAGLALAAGMEVREIADGLSAAPTVAGRLEKVRWDGDFTVLVDYAHTDDALKNVLEALKPLCRGRLIVVFGCGGDRDRSKRPRMARAAEQSGDLLFVTSDNPRTEDPGRIIEEIVAGFAEPGAGSITVEPDREKAIAMAVRTARKDDIILIAGKGHETYQIVGTQKSHFSDAEVAGRYLKER